MIRVCKSVRALFADLDLKPLSGDGVMPSIVPGGSGCPGHFLWSRLLLESHHSSTIDHQIEKLLRPPSPALDLNTCVGYSKAESVDKNNQ